MADTEFKDYGLWVIDAINPNSWSTAEERLMCRASADYMLMQESRVASDNGIAKLKRDAHNLGWCAVAEPAWPSPAGPASGGCAVFARRGTGIVVPPGIQVPEGLRHRIAIAWAAGMVPGGVRLMSIYLIDGVGLSDENLDILHHAAAVVRQLSGPWIIAGDWNVDVTVLIASRWPELIRGTVVAPTKPTCFSSTYDFFIVSQGLSQSVAGIARIDDAGLYPHKPVRLYVHSSCRRFLTRQLLRPAKVNGVLPAGPLPRPRPAGSLYPAEVTMEAVDVAARQWLECAKAEWASLAGVAPDRAAPRFRWLPAVGPRARPQAGATAQSAFWRNAARRLDECAAVIQRAVPDALSITAKHMERIAMASARACFPEDERPNVDGWCHAAAFIVGAADVVAIRRHAASAVAKAACLEAHTRNRRLADWKRTLIRPGQNDDEATATPSRRAYQWVRGATGWSKSPVGDAAMNDTVLECQAVEEDVAPAHLLEDTASSARVWRKVSGQQAPLAEQSEVEVEANYWAALWEEEFPYDAFVDPLGSPALPPLNVHDLRAASLSFPAGTGLGADNIAPRALARLSDDALRGLCAILMAAELLGKWPRIAMMVLIVLLPKPDGGRRPIGLFPVIIRVWARARAQVARRWEAENGRAGLYGGPSMGAQKAAWQAAYHAETAALSGSNYAQALLDLVKAFEKVPHDVVFRLAQKRGFNLWLVRMSVASYRLARSIGIDGAYSRMVVATRGITAGSVFATSELRIIIC